MKLKIQKLNPKAIIPSKKTEFAAGLDLYTIQKEIVESGSKLLVKTGIAMEIPTGYCGLLFIRSSIGINTSLQLSNSVGVIDSDYRGEVMVPIRNYGKSEITLEQFERFAQIVLVPIPQIDEVIEVDSLQLTERGTGGFGSTGKLN